MSSECTLAMIYSLITTTVSDSATCKDMIVGLIKTWQVFSISAMTIVLAFLLVLCLCQSGLDLIYGKYTASN